jgi:hypothetical protein
LKDARTLARTYLLRHLTSDDSAVCGDLSADIFESLISDDRLCVLHEEVVWETLLNWVEHNEQARVKLLPKLLLAIRIGLLQPSVLNEVNPNKKKLYEQVIKMSFKLKHD